MTNDSPLRDIERIELQVIRLSDDIDAVLRFRVFFRKQDARTG